MITKVELIWIVLAFGVAISVPAQTVSTGNHPEESAGAAPAANIDVPDEAQPAVDLVDAFGEALAAGDFEQVEAMLDPNVIVLEGGGVESSRREYLSHHARSDASFLAGAERMLLQRRARTDGATAWVASESELHARKDGSPLVLLSTETMVLGNTPSGWRIVHIHWSSQSKSAASAADASQT